LSCIPDTEDLEKTDEESETGQGEQLPPSQPAQQQQQLPQPPNQPPPQPQQQQGLGNSSPVLQASSNGNQGSNSLNGNSKGHDKAAASDCWLVELPPGQLQDPAGDEAARSANEEQQQQQQQQSRGGCRQSCNLQRGHPSVQPDVEQGRC
jgi:hypothetical protein